MNQKLPDGWDEKQIQEIIAFYDKQADANLLVRTRPLKRNAYAFVEVPKALLPSVRKLISKYERSKPEKSG